MQHTFLFQVIRFFLVVSLIVAVVDAVEFDWTKFSVPNRVVAFMESFSVVAVVVDLSAEPVSKMN